jgi:hypothetical protein
MAPDIDERSGRNSNTSLLFIHATRYERLDAGVVELNRYGPLGLIYYYLQVT